MGYEHILVERSGDFATVTMNRPQRRNALSRAHMHELIGAFGDLGGSDVLGIVLAGNGPVFCAGHDFADVAEADLAQVRALLQTCTELMTLMQQIPQPVVAQVHGVATAAGSATPRWSRWPATSAASAPPSWPCPVTPSTPPPRWTGAWSTGWSRRPSSA